MNQLDGTTTVCLLGLLLIVASCGGSPTTRDLNDATPPTLSLTVTASKATPSGLETIEFGTSGELVGSGGSLLVKAEDDDGVSYVELWMTTTELCNGTIR